MEPVLLVCGGCGVRIRTTDPSRARDRSCPRCAISLGPAVDRALGVEPALSIEIVPEPSKVPAPNRRSLRLPVALTIVLLSIGGTAVLAFRGTSPAPVLKQNSVHSTVVAARVNLQANDPPRLPIAEKADPDEAETVDPIATAPELTPPPPLPQKDLAILDPDARTPGLAPRPSTEIRSQTLLSDQTPPTPVAEATLAPKSGPRQLVVRDPKGRAIVAREHGIIKGRIAVVLPDGQIGLPSARVLTDEPFVPWSMDEMRRALIDDPEFATFRLLQTAHYLILYQSKTDTFAKASGDLLERLHDGLTGTLRKNGLPVQPVEFPLVAVIFETENDFRLNRKVPPDVQACYETLSNRIYFYEKSKRDQDSPEVSALRKPQTVAHEGTHQILHNVGIQPRMSDWPLWLVEGLAEYCSPPKITKKGVDWAGLGQINPIHMATIRDLDDPLPNQFQGGPRQPIAARDRRTPLVEYLVTQKDLTPTDYALAWALTHYLATKRTVDFVAYIKRMSQLQPGQEQSPKDQLDTFREVFGNDLAQMDSKIATHLKKVKQTDILPFYAVIYEQQVGPMIRRQAMVSQSPSVIRQWLESVTLPQGAQPRWEFFPQSTRKQAIDVVEQWMNQAH